MSPSIRLLTEIPGPRSRELMVLAAVLQVGLAKAVTVHTLVTPSP